MNLLAQKTIDEGRLIAGPHVTGIAIGDAMNNSKTKTITSIISYDNNEIESGMGNPLGAYSLGAFIKIPDSVLTNYVGNEIEGLRFGIDDPTIIAYATIVIYEGSLENSPVFQKPIEVNTLISGWNMATLTQGYVIKENTDLFIGVTLGTNSAGFTLTFDSDPASEPELSGFTFFNGSYLGTLTSTLDVDADYNMQAIITDGNGIGSLKDLTITGINKLTENCQLTSDEHLNIKLLNMGEMEITEKFNLTVAVNNVPLTVPVSPEGFLPDSELVVEIGTWDMSLFGLYEVTATFDFADHFSNNNTFNKKIYTGDRKIVVDLTTDAYPNETSWVLVTNTGEVVAQNEYMRAETRYVTEICVNGEGCYQWIINDSYGDGIAGYDSPSGSFTITYEGAIIGTCPGNGDFGSKFIVFGIGNGCPLSDVDIEYIDIPIYALPDYISIGGTILNNGKKMLLTFDVNYKIGDYMSPTYTVNTGGVVIGQAYDFVHNEPYLFNVDGEYTVQVIVSNPNGSIDEFSENDTLEKIINISKYFPQKKQLFEYFNSSSDKYSADFTPSLEALLSANEGECTYISYPVNWPGSGDPYYTEQVKDRIDYYTMIGLPNLYRNGMNDLNITQPHLDMYATELSTINMEAEGTYNGTSLNVEATVNAIIDIKAGLKAHIVVVEKVTTENATTNGETEFHNVLMQMIPNSSGTILKAIPANSKQYVIASYDLANTFVEKMDDLLAVVFVQDDSTKNVIQSITVPITQEPEKVNLTFNVDMSGMIDGGYFSATSDTLFVIGNFNDWRVPGAVGSIILTDADNDRIYTAKVAINKNFGKVEYLYYKNEGTGGSEWQGKPNRVVGVYDTDVTVNDTWNNSINTNPLAKADIIPNPFEDYLMLTGLEKSYKISVTNILGQKVNDVIIESTSEIITTVEWERGIYFIAVSDHENNQRVFKVLKQ